MSRNLSIAVGVREGKSVFVGDLPLAVLLFGEKIPSADNTGYMRIYLHGIGLFRRMMLALHPFRYQSVVSGGRSVTETPRTLFSSGTSMEERWVYST